jgi:hypothetical protein
MELENRKVKKGLSLKEFEELWNNAKKQLDWTMGLVDYNIVVDFNGTEIFADDYKALFTFWPEHTVILLYYRGHKTGEIKLRNVKFIY